MLASSLPVYVARLAEMNGNCPLNGPAQASKLPAS
jgi:hypothetical protein